MPLLQSCSMLHSRGVGLQTQTRADRILQGLGECRQLISLLGFSCSKASVFSLAAWDLWCLSLSSWLDLGFRQSLDMEELSGMTHAEGLTAVSMATPPAEMPRMVTRLGAMPAAAATCWMKEASKAAAQPGSACRHVLSAGHELQIIVLSLHCMFLSSIALQMLALMLATAPPAG